MEDDRDKEVHTTGSQHNVGQEEADRLGVGTHHTPEGTITISGPPGTFSTSYRPTYSFVMKDGTERKVTEACGEYLALRQQMITEFQAKFPESTTDHLYRENAADVGFRSAHRDNPMTLDPTQFQQLLIEQDPRLSSQKKAPRGRRRRDPLAAVWDSEVVPLLKSVPGLRPVAIFDEIRHRHPEIGVGVRRTLERRVR